MLLTLLLTYLAIFSLGEYGLSHSNSSVRPMLSFMNACTIIARVSVSLFPEVAKHLMHTHW
jgi:hypothetical protein